MQETGERREEPIERRVATRVADGASETGFEPASETDYEPEFEPEFEPEDSEPRAFRPPERRRVLWVTGVLLALILMVVLPPLVSMNRFRRQIATSISRSLGRPVHMDSVTLNVLPLPGFTLQNFVVGEDPAFGSEPVIRADSVRATLRVRSLWRRRVEFSRIALDSPSLNLVHRADGRWNIEGILLQASRIEAAPTAQAAAGDAPRFPYIEATGARVNVKMGLEKMPLSLTEAEFALWLPQPQQWKVRLEGHPARTDTAATDTGTLSVQGTFGKAAALVDVPVDLTSEWRKAPLGAVSWVLMGRDAGLRGEMNLTASVRGTVGENAVETKLRLSGVRRADFVPVREIEAEIGCAARATGVFHALHGVHCNWPTGGTSQGAAAGLRAEGDVADLLHPLSAELKTTLNAVPATAVLDVLRAASSRVSPALTAGGEISGNFICCGGRPALRYNGTLEAENARLGMDDGAPLFNGDLSAEVDEEAGLVASLPLALGGKTQATLELKASDAGYTMRLAGMVLRSRLLAFAKALPQFGDGLETALPPAVALAEGAVETPIRVDLTSKRTWNGGQTWSDAVAVKPPVGRKVSRRR